MNHVVVLATIPTDFVVQIDDADDDTPLQEDDRTCDYSAAEAPGNDSSNFSAADAPGNDDDDFEDGDGATVSSSDEDDTATSTIPPGCIVSPAVHFRRQRSSTSFAVLQQALFWRASHLAARRTSSVSSTTVPTLPHAGTAERVLTSTTVAFGTPLTARRRSFRT